MSIDQLVASDGYWAVVALVALESVGVPLPGETVLIAAGTYAGHSHKLNVWLVFVSATAAAIVGSAIGYWVGAKGGYPLLRRYGRYIRVRETQIKVGRYVFDRRGALVVFFGRFVAVLRTYVAFLAGVNRMGWHKFLAVAAGAAAVWAAAYSFGSYEVGSSLRRSSGRFDLVIGAAALVAVVATVLMVRRHAKRLEERAEHAYPGPLSD